MIEAKGLTKRFGPIAAVQDVSFEVAKGEIIGFLGPNAAGKTTTMRILTGFSPATQGTAIIAGFDVHDKPIEVKRRVGYLPESVPLYGEMLVSTFLSYVAEIKGIGRSARKAEVARVMERCGLEHMAKRLVKNLSKGYRQRVGLAQALIGSPPVLILDEPTVGLDPRQIIEIRQMIKSLSQDHTVLLSTHILPEVTMVCERVIIINQGRIVAQDSTANLAEADRPVLEVETSGPAAKITPILQAVPGVQSVESQSEALYRCHGAPGATALGAALSRALVEAGFPPNTIRPRTRTLEEVFVEAISREQSAQS